MTERPKQTRQGKKQADHAKGDGDPPPADAAGTPETEEHGASYGSHSGDMGLASREKQFRPGSGGR